jgi:hypothetical protein
VGAGGSCQGGVGHDVLSALSGALLLSLCSAELQVGTSGRTHNAGSKPGATTDLQAPFRNGENVCEAITAVHIFYQEGLAKITPESEFVFLRE